MTTRTCLVTGGGSGIGASIAERMVADGYSVAIADIAGDRAQEVADRLSTLGTCLPFTADVASEGDVARMTGEIAGAFGSIDVVVNNACPQVVDVDLHELSFADWNHDFTSLHAAFLCTRAALGGMIERGNGVIVNITSVNALQYLGNEAYSAAKAGIISLTKSVAVRYGRHGIRANAIAPGTIRTPIWDHRMVREPHVLDNLVANFPLGRVGMPEDVAAMAAFLASDEASWISGACFTVDGGLTAGSLALTQALLAEGK
jgi:NAD(P)-dependent dehydrogenase (short-subunit alcohol dehydrogenase family)